MLVQLNQIINLVAHAEILSFEASFVGKRFIVNSGISTYWDLRKRYYERSTKSHSTLEIDNINSTEVWSLFGSQIEQK